MEGFCLIGHAGLFKTTAENLHIVGIERSRVFLYLVIVGISLELSCLVTDDGHGAFTDGFVEIHR